MTFRRPEPNTAPPRKPRPPAQPPDPFADAGTIDPMFDESPDADELARLAR